MWPGEGRFSDAEKHGCPIRKSMFINACERREEGMAQGFVTSGCTVGGERIGKAGWKNVPPGRIG